MYHFREYLKHLYKVGVTPVFLYGKLRCREIKQQAHSHMAFKYIHQNLNPGLSDTKAQVCTFHYNELFLL